jgi:hypothetical protein
LPEPEFAPLIDISDVTLRELAADTDDNSPLARAARRLLKDIEDEEGALTAFQSFIS